MYGPFGGVLIPPLSTDPPLPKRCSPPSGRWTSRSVDNGGGGANPTLSQASPNQPVTGKISKSTLGVYSAIQTLKKMEFQQR